MMFIDTHVHLNHPDLYQHLDDYINKAKEAQVNHMLVIGFNDETNARAIEIAQRYSFIKAAIGFHPSDAHQIKQEAFRELETLLKQDEVVAIGECGLDFYRDKSHMDQQIAVFERQIALAKIYDLPLVIHMREASQATYAILAKHAPLKGVMHCYSGSVEMVERFLALGLHIALGGPVTFKNAKTPKEVAKFLPLDKLLLETDAPYLAPHPYRGKQNDSSYLPLIAQAIADLKGIPLETIGKKTTQNAQALFKFNP